MHPAVIGPYEILRELGRGGMGEVFLARDTRLDRQVAVKALPAHLAQDPDRLARFQREAKVLASLNHPGIGAIYGLEEVGGHQYLILEYVEGKTLADRLVSGAIPVDEALTIAKQIAEALEAAHEKGVVHRDLKPANVMVTSDGAVKVLDFGLARTADGSPSTTNSPGGPEAPTLPIPSPTVPGAIMGTAGYMSPEQARGKPVDKRSDIFSFGCIFYETLTGNGPFSGETVTDSLGAILHGEPEWTRLPAQTPVRIRELLTRCLVKDRKNRLHDIGDARIEIEQAFAHPHGAGAITGHGLLIHRSWWHSPAVLATTSLLAAAAIVIALALTSPRGAPIKVESREVRATLGLPNGMDLCTIDRAVAVSPDGSHVAIVARTRDGTQSSALYLRDLARLEFRPLTGTKDASSPFWSPDGKSIAFFADEKLKRIDVADGIVRVLCDAPAGRGGSWSAKGTIVFAPSAIGGLLIVRDVGGTPAPITVPETPDASHRNPHFLPGGLGGAGGERFLYYRQNTEADGVYAFDLATKESKLILPGEAEAMFIEPVESGAGAGGLLAFVRDDNLIVQPFDLQRLELTGIARPIAAGVQHNTVRGTLNLGINGCGALVYQPIQRDPRMRLAWMDLKGERTPLAIEPFPVWSASLSPDARRAAVDTNGDHGEQSMTILDLERGTRTPVGDPSWSMISGVWSPGTQSVVCTRRIRAGFDIVSVPLAGGPPRVLVAAPGFEYFPGSVAPDGRTLLYSQWHNRDKTGELMTLSLDSDQPPKAYMTTTESEFLPRISPAGDAIVYRHRPGGAPLGLLYVVAYPSPAVPVQVSLTPVEEEYGWLGGGGGAGSGEVFWVDSSHRMWSAAVTTKDGQVDAALPREMLTAGGGHPLDEHTRVLTYDPPRQRFLIGIEDEPQEQAHLIVVSDWRAETDGARAAHK